MWRLASNRCTPSRLSFLSNISFFPSGDQSDHQVITRFSHFERVENMSNELSSSLDPLASARYVLVRVRRIGATIMPHFHRRLCRSIRPLRNPLSDGESHFNLDHSFGAACFRLQGVSESDDLIPQECAVQQKNKSLCRSCVSSCLLTTFALSDRIFVDPRFRPSLF